MSLLNVIRSFIKVIVAGSIISCAHNLCLAGCFVLTAKVRVFMGHLQWCLGEQWCVQA